MENLLVSGAAVRRESQLGSLLPGEHPSRARNSQERNPYASSWILRCGNEATIAGQATMATKARATRMSCIVDSFRKNSCFQFLIAATCDRDQ